MSEADKMFEELGYEKSLTEVDNIKYYKDDDNVIYFVITHKTFHKTGEYDGMCDAITMQELQAINKKCKEMRMELKKEWKEIRGYENKYIISNYGEIISLPIDILYCPMCRKEAGRVICK